MSQDIPRTDIYIGNVFEEDVASVGCEKSDVYNPHMTAPRHSRLFLRLVIFKSARKSTMTFDANVDYGGRH